MGRRRARPVLPLRILRPRDDARHGRRVVLPQSRGVDLDPRSLRPVPAAAQHPFPAGARKAGLSRGAAATQTRRTRCTRQLRRVATCQVRRRPHGHVPAAVQRQGLGVPAIGPRLRVGRGASGRSGPRAGRAEPARRSRGHRLGTQQPIPIPGARRNRRDLAAARGDASRRNGSPWRRSIAASISATLPRIRRRIARALRHSDLDHAARSAGAARTDAAVGRRRCRAEVSPPSTWSASGLCGTVPPTLAKKCWIYFPEEIYPFYRLTVFSNYSPSNVPDAVGTGRSWWRSPNRLASRSIANICGKRSSTDSSRRG